MNITVFGATGRTGRALLAEARRSGHRTTAHVREATRLRGAPADRVIAGPVFDPATVGQAVSGADAVVIAFGLHRNRTSPLYSDGTRCVVEAMHTGHVRRLLVVSEAAYGEHVEGFAARALAAVYRRVNAPAVLQRQEQDAIVHASGLEWTFIRPTLLVDRPRGRDGLPAPSLTPHRSPWRRVAFSDLAVQLLASLDDPSTHRRSLYP